MKKLAYCALLCNNPAMFAKVQLDSVPRPSISLDTTRCVEEKLPAIANNFDIQTGSKRNENVALACFAFGGWTNEGKKGWRATL